MRVIGRPFAKGASGNPGGRPRSSFDFSAAAREYAPEYLAVLLTSLKSNNWRERHSALAMLMDRAFGKTPMEITGQDRTSVALLHLAAARTISEELRATLVQRTIEGQDNGKPEPVALDFSTPPLE